MTTSKVDVLIVGAGPAGLMTANWLSRLNVKTRIIDKRGTKIFKLVFTPVPSPSKPEHYYAVAPLGTQREVESTFREHCRHVTWGHEPIKIWLTHLKNGQADGLQCRTLEIFDSFEFVSRVWKESNHMLEINLWNPDEHGKLFRSDKIPDTIPNISRFQQVVLHQGRIERFFLDSISAHSDIVVERGVLPESLQFDEALAEDDDAYPIKLNLRHLSEEEATPKQSATSANGAGIQDGLFRSNLATDDTQELLNASKLANKAGSTETVEAKYVIGCDGAHSWVRNQLGFKLRGESTDYIWGVLDVIPITDFPDIRMRCAIHSANNGSLMVIPRENKLVRLYIQLTTTNETGGKKVDRSKINPEVILGAAQKILHPYKITYKYCDWWTAYQIGQRVGDNFSLNERIFLAGDAVHTHSPKAGQGMNVSMQDTYNLGWKLGAVINGFASRSILKTYQSERRRVAQDLIDFDHRFSRLFSGRPAKDVMDEEGINMAEFKEAFVKGNMFASGLSVDYGKSLLVAKEGSAAEQGDGTEMASSSQLAAQSKPSLATNIPLGMRMPSFKVLNQSDARPWHFQEVLPSNGRWRIVVFTGDILSNSTQNQRLQTLGQKLAAPNSFIRKYTPSTQSFDSVIECLAVHSSPRKDATIFNFPTVFRPFTKADGWDYSKIYVDDESYHEGHGEAYKNYGVDKDQGCAVILRPDQYVSWVGEVDDYENMERFFQGFMKEQKGGCSVDIEEDWSGLESENKQNGNVTGMNGAVEGEHAGAM